MVGRRMKWNLLGLMGVVMSGCSAPARTNDSSSLAKDVPALVAAAEREIEVNRALDYRAPRLNLRRQAQDRAVALLFEACKLGDVRSCWWAVELPDHATLPDAHAMATVLAKSCLRGEAKSCHALSSDSFRESALSSDQNAEQTFAMCEQGLAAACYAAGHRINDHRSTRRSWMKKGCELGDSQSCAEVAKLDAEAGKPAVDIEASLRVAAERAEDECGRGITSSCFYLVREKKESPQRLELAARAGCEEGILGDCSALLLVEPIAPANAAFAARQQCTLQGKGCGMLASVASGPEEIRDAFEHGCQLQDYADCMQLVKRYRAHELEEPVPGRSADLASYLCTSAGMAEACALER